MARNFSKQSKATANGIIDWSQFPPSGELTEEKFLFWFNIHIVNYYTKQEVDNLLNGNLEQSKAYTDGIADKLQAQIDVLSGDFDTSLLVLTTGNQNINGIKTFALALCHRLIGLYSYSHLILTFLY